MVTTALQTAHEAQIAALDRDDAYRPGWRQYLAWAGDRPALDYQTVRDYFQDLNANGYRAATVSIKRAAVKSRIRLAGRGMDPAGRMHLEQQLRDLDHDVPCPKGNGTAVPASKIVSVPELERLVAAAGPRQRLLVLALFCTGLRVSELAGALLENCTEEGATVGILVRGKGGRERTVPMPAALYRQIRETFNGQCYLFETATGRRYDRRQISDSVRRLARRVLGRKLSAHCMRHSLATRLILAHPGKIDAIARLLGHSSPGITTAYYLHTTLGTDELFGDLADLVGGI